MTRRFALGPPQRHCKAHHTAPCPHRIGKPIPVGAMRDDLDGDGTISWAEFSGPKGSHKDEL